MLDKDLVDAESVLIQVPRAINTAKDLDYATDRLIEHLTRIAEKATPRRKGGGGRKAAPWWSRDVGEAVREVRQAARHYRNTRTQEAWEALNKATAKQQKAITVA